MNHTQDFKKFALDQGLSSMDLYYHGQQIEASMTPYILEEREMRVTQMDVFSRLLRDRIIWISGVVDQRMCDVTQAQLMFLDSTEKKDITLHINSPGGSVLHGLGIIDVMNYISSDIQTINTGMAASMGSVLLSSGTKGKRSSLLHSRVMTHQVSHGMQGNIQDTSISHMEGHKLNYILFNILAQNCGKTFEEMIESSRRDKWFNSTEALEFGLIDEVIGSGSGDKMLVGFEQYYAREVLAQ